MKIAKGHYVPKELITSEAVHEAVVKCFVAAGFKDRRPMYGNFKRMESFAGLSVDNQGEISWGCKGSSAQKPLTLQQLFTADNGLQWPDGADSVISYGGDCVAFVGDDVWRIISGKMLGFETKMPLVLATRQPKEKELKNIEDAVIYHNGVWPVEDGGFLVYHKKEDEYSVSYDACIHTHAEQIVCNEQEFESAAKRIGYINGYRWGVEYPTNGKRPELPNDVFVERKFVEGWSQSPCPMRDFIVWTEVKPFRITDPRYKPADTSYLNQCKYSGVADVDQLKVKCMHLIDDKPVDELAVSHSSIDGVHAGDKISIRGLKRKPSDEDGLEIIEKYLSKPDDSLSGRAVMANEMSKLGRKAAAELADDVDNAIRESVKELINDPSNQLASNWHELGELPPVGEKIEYTTTEYQEGKPAIEVGKWYFGKIIAYHNGFVWTSDNGIRKLSVTKFRPTRTEREKVIEAAVKLFSGGNIYDMYNTLYSAGMLVLPPKKSDTED